MSLGLLLLAESCPSHGFNGRVRPAHLDMCCALPAEEVEQQLAWRSGDAGSGFSPPGPDGLSGPRPLQLKARAAQPPREDPAGASDIAPQGLVHGPFVRSRTATAGSAYVLAMDEELIEAGDPTHPSDPEETWRRSRSERPYEPREAPQRERSLSSLSQSAPPTGQDKPRTSEIIALAQDQVRGRDRGSSMAQGASVRRGPSSSNRSLSRARSTASKNPATSPECSRAGGRLRGPLRTRRIRQRRPAVRGHGRFRLACERLEAGATPSSTAASRRADRRAYWHR